MSCICTDEKPCAFHAFRTLELLRLQQSSYNMARLVEHWTEMRAQYGTAIYGELS